VNGREALESGLSAEGVSCASLSSRSAKPGLRGTIKM
jgi:hypothetical protein